MVNPSDGSRICRGTQGPLCGDIRLGAKRPLLTPQFIQPKPQLGLRRGRPELRHSRPEEGTKAPLGVETGLGSGCVVNMAKEEAIYIYTQLEPGGLSALDLLGLLTPEEALGEGDSSCTPEKAYSLEEPW